ncbi:MAG TPA: ABC transporter substrate-binding protein [Thermoanaerobaculia bacterium]|nr:ABC transporter substrate-binding protein [Thermoanaerobaculia bacterium]
MTDYISAYSDHGNLFIPRLFQGFPEIKEALMSDKIQAGFMVAPMAIALRAQGVPVRIVYLGHRYGSAVVVGKDSAIRSPADLRGRTIAIPSRFSNERLVVYKVLRDLAIPPDEVRLVEMAPPDVAGALASSAIDAFSMGEPFPSQAEIGGFGRVLFHAKDVWPDYTSCVLVVRQDVIDRRPETVQILVDGIARSGIWLDDGRENREHAAEFVGRFYYRQDPKLLRWALTNPLDRVKYTPLTPYKDEFDLIVDLMLETETLDRHIEFSEYVDAQFAEGAKHQTAWKYKPGSGRAE